MLNQLSKNNEAIQKLLYRELYTGIKLHLPLQMFFSFFYNQMVLIYLPKLGLNG